jgi:hypothetical protein
VDIAISNESRMDFDNVQLHSSRVPDIFDAVSTLLADGVSSCLFEKRANGWPDSVRRSVITAYPQTARDQQRATAVSSTPLLPAGPWEGPDQRASVARKSPGTPA